MAQEYRGKFRWRPTRIDLLTLALRDEENRDLLFARRGKFVAEGLMLYLDSSFDEPLLSVKCTNFSRLNPPYEIKSLKSGEQIGKIQVMAEEIEQRWYRLHQSADGAVTEFRPAGTSNAAFTATQEDRVLGTFSFTPTSWSGANEAVVNFSSDSANFLLLFGGWLFVLTKQFEDFFIHQPGGAY